MARIGSRQGDVMDSHRTRAVVLFASAFVTLLALALAAPSAGAQQLGMVERVASPTCDPALTGTPAAETITGTSGDDHICGMGGNDTLIGLGGNDIIEGGTGADVMRAGAGDDVLRGGR